MYLFVFFGKILLITLCDLSLKLHWHLLKCLVALWKHCGGDFGSLRALRGEKHLVDVSCKVTAAAILWTVLFDDGTFFALLKLTELDQFVLNLEESSRHMIYESSAYRFYRFFRHFFRLERLPFRSQFAQEPCLHPFAMLLCSLLLNRNLHEALALVCLVFGFSCGFGHETRWQGIKMIRQKVLGVNCDGLKWEKGLVLLFIVALKFLVLKAAPPRPRLEAAGGGFLPIF